MCNSYSTAPIQISLLISYHVFSFERKLQWHHPNTEVFAQLLDDLKDSSSKLRILSRHLMEEFECNCHSHRCVSSGIRNCTRLLRLPLLRADRSVSYSRRLRKMSMCCSLLRSYSTGRTHSCSNSSQCPASNECMGIKNRM